MGVPTADATESTIGGRYLLEAVIGRGGAASVYRARDTVLGRSVAAKVFHASAPGEEEARRQEIELRLLAGLNHHGLVTLLDAGVESDSFGQPHRYIIMELVTGSDLQQKLEKEVLAPRFIGELGYDLAEALDYVHAHGVVHRDIKPSNILMVDYGVRSERARAKLTDFGIALASGSERLTAEGITTGTAAYLSPEQARGEVAGTASDVYSLGLVLLECFTRQIAFPGRMVESALARLSHDPDIPGSIPGEWRQLLSAMTAREPAARPSTHQLIAALRQLVIVSGSRHREEEPELYTQPINQVSPYPILDAPADGSLDRITSMAARAFSAPVAIVVITDGGSGWFSSQHGLDAASSRADSFAPALLRDEPWIIEDAATDLAGDGNPLTAGDRGFSFYAGVPLRTVEGTTIGTLCVLDSVARVPTADQLATLIDLAALVMNEVELRRESRRTAEGLAIRTDQIFGERVTGELPGA